MSKAPPIALDFLLCTERSGSNFITHLLNAHSQICGPTPAHLVRTLAVNLNRFGGLENDSDWRRITDVAADILKNQLGQWSTQWSGEHIRAEIGARTPAAILRTVFAAEAAANNKNRAFIKENRVHQFAPFILASFPEARFVWLTRDPRDVALSWKKSPNHPGGVVKASEVWAEDQREARKLYACLRHEGRITHLRYEELIADPAAVLKSLCGFLGVEFEPAMLKFHEESATRSAAGRIANWSNLAKPVLSNNSGKFSAELTRGELRLIEYICQTEMRFLGYRLAGQTISSSAFDELAKEQPSAPPVEQVLDKDEQAIRQRRLAVIERINRHDEQL